MSAYVSFDIDSKCDGCTGADKCASSCGDSDCENSCDGSFGVSGNCDSSVSCCDDFDYDHCEDDCSCGSSCAVSGSCDMSVSCCDDCEYDYCEDDCSYGSSCDCSCDHCDCNDNCDHDDCKISAGISFGLDFSSCWNSLFNINPFILLLYFLNIRGGNHIF